jgi:CheY-like chemotaxis protein
MARILVVDDSASLRLVLAAVLHDAGYDVRQASDGVEALEEITTAPPDLVLSDIHMPRMDGLALLQQARTLVPSRRWILMSGTRRRPIQIPVPFLPKPFDLDDLLALISRVLVT